MKRRAYAKINLGLRITGQRSDGYHNIETLYHHIDIYDELEFEPAKSITLECAQPGVPQDATNLCVRAALLFRELHALHEGVRIRLRKHIPVGAGLGGGSSDAAATLLALAALWNKPTPESDLRGLALRLGSDVPFFLDRRSAFATGRGEILDYFDLDLPYWIVVVYPGVHISTAWAYGETHLPDRAPGAPLKSILLENFQQLRLLTHLIKNDFEPLLLRTHPVIAQVRQALALAGAEFVLLSGSGSAVFGLFNDGDLVSRAVEELGKNYIVFTTPPHFHPS